MLQSFLSSKAQQVMSLGAKLNAHGIETSKLNLTGEYLGIPYMFVFSTISNDVYLYYGNLLLTPFYQGRLLLYCRGGESDIVHMNSVLDEVESIHVLELVADQMRQILGPQIETSQSYANNSFVPIKHLRDSDITEIEGGSPLKRINIGR